MTTISVDGPTTERLIEELDGSMLRISFTTGCGGSGYRLASASEPLDGDIRVQQGEVTILLDDLAARNLVGAVIRWNDEEDGFTIDHPNAAIATWCG